MPRTIPTLARRPRLLFTGGGGAGSGALVSLLSADYDVHFADADPDARPAGVSSRAWHALPYAAAPEFVDRLRQLCRDLAVDALLPGVDEELLPIALARSTFECDVVLPPADFIAAHLDKLSSAALLRALGIPVPETEALASRGSVQFPCVVKPRRGRGSRHVAIVNSEDELRAHVLISRRPPDDFIVQEQLLGQEYTVTVVADRLNRLRAVVPVKVGLKRGVTLRAQTDHDTAVTEACIAIHAAQPAAGCFNIQVIRTASGDVKPFEINPRISTTSCLALAAGVNFVDLYRREGPQPMPDDGLAAFTDGLQLRRSWLNEFIQP